MNDLDQVRFAKELSPHAPVILNWLGQCEAALLPGVGRDYQRIRDELFLDKPVAAEGEKPLYLATAGGPCSGKSTELDYEVASGADPRYGRAVTIDPDRYTMDYMFTYRDLLSAGAKATLGAKEAARQAYDRARPGSNVISNLNLNEAFNGGYHIVHGTTNTSPFIKAPLAKLGEAGYERRLLLCAAPDEMRMAAGAKRIGTEAHYQVDPADFVEKGKAFPQRHEDYFTYGDHLILLWKPDVEHRATRAAEFKDGRLTVRDQAAYRSYVEKYQGDRAALSDAGVAIPDWNTVQEKYFNRFAGSSARTVPSGPAP